MEGLAANTIEYISQPITEQELKNRLERFCEALNDKHPEWDTVLIVSRINQYYFTGTMQEGLLMIKNDRMLRYFARRSYERAKLESPLTDCVFPMESYRDIAEVTGRELGVTLIESEVLTVAMLERLKKHFSIKKKYPVEDIIFKVRALKSQYEIDIIKAAGKYHKKLLEEVAPALMREGMTEVDFTAEFYENMLKMGFHGVSRFYRYQTEMIVGQVAFGENSLYPTNFDGPGGMKGLCPAVPLLGSRDRRLKKGDLVFLDVGYGMDGYHSDRTQVYMFGGKPSAEVVAAHRRCLEIEKRAAEMLKPGKIASDIYNEIMNDLEPEFLDNFMGFGSRRVKFLGHGIGLHVDEYPVIANGFNTPLKENMAIALEPKKGIAGVGMVGVEDTYLVTPEGGKCITGGECDIIVV